MNHIELGQKGEEIAVEHLQKTGYSILDRNFKFKKAEIDIVCQKNEQLIIVEVKTRHTAVIGEPYLAVTRSKQRQIIKVANKYIEEKKIDFSLVREDLEKLTGQGKTPMILSVDGNVEGIITTIDALKPYAKETVHRLKMMGLKVMMVTGDNRKTAQAVARKLEIDDVVSEVLPSEKRDEIRKQVAQGHKVAMVGDGINDAPALAESTVGIALGSGTDVAMEASDITLVTSDLRAVPQAIELSRKTLVKIRQNLFWAFFYNVLGIPIAAGLLYPFYGVLLKPVYAAVAMSLSSVSVVGNSLLLKRFSPSKF